MSDLADSKLIQESIDFAARQFIKNVENVVSEKLGVVDASIVGFLSELAQLGTHMEGRTKSVAIPSAIPREWLPLLRYCLAETRLMKARVQERRSKLAVNASILEKQRGEVQPYDDILKQSWTYQLRYRPPMLSDFMTPSEATKHLKAEHSEELEQNFGILRAKSSLLQNMLFHRERCEMRGLPLSVAFVDIDEFKALNTKHTHSIVDQYFLRQFLVTLEAAVCYQGEAYRYGGDEFVLLLPNKEHGAAIDVLREVMRKAGELPNELDFHPTLSIGLCVVEPGSIFTEEEILFRANQMEARAKEAGKNRIVSCFASELIVLDPVEHGPGDG